MPLLEEQLKREKGGGISFTGRCSPLFRIARKRNIRGVPSRIGPTEGRRANRRASHRHSQPSSRKKEFKEPCQTGGKMVYGDMVRCNVRSKAKKGVDRVEESLRKRGVLRRVGFQGDMAVEGNSPSGEQEHRCAVRRGGQPLSLLMKKNV